MGELTSEYNNKSLSKGSSNNYNKVCGCSKCNEISNNLKKYTVKNRRYGSIFQDDIINIYLCDTCSNKVSHEWFNNEPVGVKNNIHEYENEFQLLKFLERLPVENYEQAFKTYNFEGHCWNC